MMRLQSLLLLLVATIALLCCVSASIQGESFTSCIFATEERGSSVFMNLCSCDLSVQYVTSFDVTTAGRVNSSVITVPRWNMKPARLPALPNNIARAPLTPWGNRPLVTAAIPVNYSPSDVRRRERRLALTRASRGTQLTLWCV